MSEEWNMTITESTSKNGTFKFKHHSTSSVVEISFHEEDQRVDKFFMDYYQFGEFLQFIKDLQ